jgi:DNA-binding LacI/PurR family transcriptional regulator
MKEKRITLKDIALECGLAVSTVSNILNDHKDSFASDRVKQVVKDAAERLGYKKDFLSMSLRTKRTFSIGLCMDEVGNETRRFFIKTFVSMFNKKGYEVALQEHLFSPKKALDSLNFFEERYKDGIVMFMDFLREPNEQEEALAQALQKSQCRVLGVGSGFKGLLPCHDIDRAWAFRDGLQKLRTLGHRKICIVYKSRYDYREAFEDLCSENIIHMEGVENPEGFAERWDKVHQENLDISAIFFRSDVVGVRASMWLQQSRKLRIPEDLSVLSFDNFSFADYSSPRISTYDIHMSQLGEECFESLIHWIDSDIKPDNSTYRLVKPVFKARESLGSFTFNK